MLGAISHTQEARFLRMTCRWVRKRASKEKYKQLLVHSQHKATTCYTLRHDMPEGLLLEAVCKCPFCSLVILFALNESL